MKFVCTRIETNQSFTIDWPDAKSVEDVVELFRAIAFHTKGTWNIIPESEVNG